jgi:hypothetical protein
MFDLIIGGIVIFIAYAIFSAWKNNNPEKWAKFQQELIENEAKCFADNYEKAFSDCFGPLKSDLGNVPLLMKRTVLSLPQF